MIAGGLYVDGSVFDNSCRPNAICVFNGPVMTVRALRDIDSEQEKITICYLEGGLMLPKGLRREYIREFGHFDCQCNVCIDPSYSDDARNEFVPLTPVLFRAMAEEKIDEVQKIFIKIFQLIQSVLGRYSKAWIEYMILFMEFNCDQIRKRGSFVADPKSIQIIIEWNEFRSSLQKTHGTDHPLYQVCLTFGKIICPNSLHITGNAENPDILKF